MTGGHAWQGDVYGRGHAWQGSCMAGGGHAWWGACMVGACVAGGTCVAGKTAIVAGGAHPTGMHSSFKEIL